MQSEPYLLSPAKSGVLVEEISLSARDILLLFFGLVFVIFGAADLFSRAADVLNTKPVKEEVTIESLNEAAPIATSTLTASVYAAPFVPTRISVPVLKVDTDVQSVGRKPDGAMKTPSNFTDVAWFKEGSLPGEAGNAVIAGHLNNALDTSGVFEHLHTLTLGDTIILSNEYGREARYVVREMSIYDAALAPNEKVFSKEGPSRVVLITCNGAFDKGKRSYDKRLVVYADLQSAQ